MRIIICGGPRTGKTQLAKHLSLKFDIPKYLCTDPQALGGDALDHTELPERERWSAISADVSQWFDEPGPWIIEGVAAIRALRKWHKNTLRVRLHVTSAFTYQMQRPSKPKGNKQ